MSAGMVRAWSACLLNFVPLLWMVWLSARHEKRDVAFLWVATAFAVGGVADIIAALGLGWEMAGHVYPVGQSALIAAVLLDKYTAGWCLGLLGWVALGSLLIWPTHPDVPLHLLAWGTLAWIGWRARSTPFWLPLACAFGVALPFYLWLVGTRGLVPWVLMQSAYGAGIYYFCVAASRTRTDLAIA